MISILRNEPEFEIYLGGRHPSHSKNVNLKRSAGWMSQRINGNKVFNKKAMFRETEYHQMAEAFRHIATRLQAHADETDAAAPDEEIPEWPPVRFSVVMSLRQNELHPKS